LGRERRQHRRPRGRGEDQAGERNLHCPAARRTSTTVLHCTTPNRHSHDVSLQRLDPRRAPW
jgi:hypothetical protein